MSRCSFFIGVYADGFNAAAVACDNVEVDEGFGAEGFGADVGVELNTVGVVGLKALTAGMGFAVKVLDIFAVSTPALTAAFSASGFDCPDAFAVSLASCAAFSSAEVGVLLSAPPKEGFGAAEGAFFAATDA